MRQTLKQEFKLLKRFYIFYFLWGLCSFIAAYWIIYLNSIGLTFSQISIIISASLIAPIIFEVPTGAITDHFGRRISIVLGMVSVGALYLLVPFTTQFLPLLLLIFSFMSLATLISGSDSAWMVDFLKSKRKDNLINSAFARVASLVGLGAVIALVLSGVVVEYFGMTYLWYLQGALIVSTGLFVLFFGDKEVNRKRSKFQTAVKSTFGFAKKGFKLIFIRRSLLYFSLALFFGSFFGIGSLVWQPFFIDINLPLSKLGILYAGAAVIGILAPMLSSTLVRKLGSEKWALILEDVLIGILFVLVSIISSPLLAVLIFYTGAIGESMAQPIRAAFFHKRVPSDIRATAGSIKNLIKSAGGVIAVLIAGWVVDIYGLRAGFFVAGLATVPTIIFYLMIKEKDKNK